MKSRHSGDNDGSWNGLRGLWKVVPRKVYFVYSIIGKSESSLNVDDPSVLSSGALKGNLSCRAQDGFRIGIKKPCSYLHRHRHRQCIDLFREPLAQSDWNFMRSFEGFSLSVYIGAKKEDSGLRSSCVGWGRDRLI